MNIWLDDQRNAPDGWIHLHNIEEVEHLVQTILGLEGVYTETMSFDYHLSHQKRGIDVMKYLADQCTKYKTKRFWPKIVLYHSSDPKGVKVMKDFAKVFEKKILFLV